MAKSTITVEEGAELKRLYAELPKAYERAGAALMGHDGPDREAARARLMEAAAEARRIARRIKEILGTTGQPWNA